jgi:hypothetical protein
MFRLIASGQIRFAVMSCFRIVDNNIEIIQSRANKAALNVVCGTDSAALLGAIVTSGARGFFGF